ncbi:MAG: type II toxin-antitoxin system prevent-host-death family antitoxin [Thermoanaerobaculia bacterium]
MKDRNPESRSIGATKAHFAECVRSVENGETIVLTRHGRPVARLVPLETMDDDTQRILSGARRSQVSEVRESAVEYEGRADSSGYKTEARRKILQRLFEEEIWPQIPSDLIGKGPSKHEREQILGIGEDGT